MKILFIDTPTPMSFGYALCEPFPYELLKETKTLTIHPHLFTKTRVSTSVFIGNHSSCINIPIEGFKTHEEQGYDYINGKHQSSHFFVKGKKQGLTEYKLYLTEVLEHFFGNTNIDELKVNLITDRIF